MGRPTILLATSRFADFARQAADGYGLRGARIAVVEHPIGGVSEEVVVARAAAAVEQVLQLLQAGRG